MESPQAIEMTIAGVEAEYDIHFNSNFYPEHKARFSGTSMAEEPDEPAYTEYFDLEVEAIGAGGMMDLSESEEEYAIGVLIDMDNCHA
jgi:hypothetical protein